MPTKKKTLSPTELLAEVRGQKPAKTYEFDDYIEVINELKRKDYSYAEIAKFVAEKLGISATRGQVYRAHMLWLEAKEEAEREAAEARIDSEMAGEDFEEPPEQVDEAERVRREIAADVYKMTVTKYPHSAFSGEYADIFKFVLAMCDPETSSELAAAAEDKRLEVRKGKADVATTRK